MTLRLSLFGAPSITYGDSVRSLDFERRGQLLAYLALKRGWVGRGEIASLLWPEQETKLAYANLRKALFRLGSMPWADRVESNGNALRFDVPTDVADFETALREGRLAAAVDLRRGDLLAGFDDDANEPWNRWLGFERDRLRLAWRAAAQEMLAAATEPHAAVELAARLYDDDPLDESALASYMTALARTGQGTRARQAYRDFATRLGEELGLAPGAELKALHDSMGLVAVRTPGVALPVAAAPSDGFVGRTGELRRIATLLEEEGCRLVTILGPGGVGKTRLARRSLHDLAARFADGAIFVSLEDITSTPELASRLVHALQIKAARVESIDEVIEHLRERQTLIVLDNFEQLVDEAPVLDRMLSECPALNLVVTSRMRLALDAEWVLPLDGLPCPEVEDEDRIESFDAARLFLRVARRVAPSLVPAVEAPAIVEICRLLEGLPLALELAAAWVRVLSCQDIANELRQGTALLKATERAHPDRHASLEGVFDQSWRMLGERERAALAQLSVFRGGFTADAARTVCGVALPVLASLVDKSLVRREGARCSLHPLVQQFADARLEASYDPAATQVAHARHFLRRMADATHHVSHAEPGQLRELDVEFENVRGAWRHAVGLGLGEELVGAGYALMSYCDHRGRRVEGLEMMQEALAAASIAAQPRFVQALSTFAAWLAYRLDRYAEAEALGLRALGGSGTGRTTSDPVLAYRAATALGAACARMGRAEDAGRWFERALEGARKGGDPNNIAGALHNLGFIARSRGDLDQALELYGKAFRNYREVGDAGGEALSLNSQGVLYLLRRELDAAQAVLSDAARVCERNGLPTTRCMVEVNLANVTMMTGNAEGAVAHASRALDLSIQIGQRATECEARHVLVWAATVRGDLAEARAQLGASLSLALSIARPTLLVHGVRLFADLLAQQGAPDLAARVMAFVLKHAGLVAAEREEAEQQMLAWSAGDASRPWAGPSLEELAQRIVAQTNVGYSPLMSELRA